MEPISSQHKDPEPKNMEQIEHQEDSTDIPYVGMHIVNSKQDENEKLREKQKRYLKCKFILTKYTQFKSSAL